MSPTKAETGKKAAPRKGAASARSEAEKTQTNGSAPEAEANGTGPAPKALKWEGLEFTLPPEIPRTIMFDLVEVEADGDENPMPVYRLLRSLLGPEQFVQVRNKIADDEDLDESDLIALILGQYGLESGE